MTLGEVAASPANETATLLAAAAFVISVLIAILGVVAKTLLSRTEKEMERRLERSEKDNAEIRGDMKLLVAEHSKEMKAHHDRLHAEELATVKQDGEIARLQDKHDVFVDDIHEIKRSMATKAEILSLEKSIMGRFDDLLGKPARPAFQQRLTPGGYTGIGRGAQTEETTSPPPRDRDRDRDRNR